MKILIECGVAPCRKKGRGQGPTGGKIIGKIYTPFARAQFLCPYCGKFTNVYGELSPANSTAVLEKIENPALKAILTPRTPSA